MKKLYAVLCGLLLLGVFFVGMYSLFDKDPTFSLRENRALKTKPDFSISALLDGSYISGICDYYADTFPNRERLMNTNRALNGFYRFSGLSSEGQLVVDLSSGAADHGEAHPGEETSSGDLTKPSGTEATEPTLPSISEPDAAAEQLGSVLLVGNRAMDVPYFSSEMVQKYADAVTKIADALGSEVRTFSMPVPNAAAFYSPSEYRTGSYSQENMLSACQKALGDNVIYVDSYSVILQHTQEYLYFRTDHHWTQLGAYYAYLAFCQEAGFTPVELDQLETGQWDNFVGSLYTSISDYPQSQILEEQPDTVYYYKPCVECDTSYYSDKTLSDPYPIGSISHIDDSVSNKYLTFMGGDHPITIIDTGSDGSVCILLKESYGNAFAPWLINNYSKVIAIDPREFNRSGKPSLDLAAFAKEQGATDCIVLNYPMMLNSESYISWLERLIDGMPTEE